MQIKNILVQVDFSPPSRVALTQARALSEIFQARLTLLHVVESAVAPAFPAEAARSQKEHYKQSRRMMPALLTPKDRQNPNLKTEVRSGNIVQEMFSVAREDKSDLIVMGAHGRGLFGRWLIGSVTEKVLRGSTIPVVTVGRVSQPLELRRILFATDFSGSWKEGSRFALNFARRARANLIGLHVIEIEAQDGAEAAVYLRDLRVEEARTKMDEFQEMAIEEGVAIDTVFVDGVAGTAILQTAGQESTDLIVLTIPKGRLADENLVGTTVTHVIREAHIPVLTVPIGVETREREASAA
jgi:nucleotide-binding universal stress UspA family protein